MAARRDSNPAVTGVAARNAADWATQALGSVTARI